MGAYYQCMACGDIVIERFGSDAHPYCKKCFENKLKRSGRMKVK